MTDREKVIRHIIAEIGIAKICKKDFALVDIDMLSDALSMLKEQEEAINYLTDATRQLNQYIKELREYMTPYGRVADVKAYDELLKEKEDLGTELTKAMELIHKKNERIEKLLKKQDAQDAMDIRKIDGLWCDDITFCQELCGWESCPRNQQNIRDRSVPHSFSVGIPEDCPKWKEGR